MAEATPIRPGIVPKQGAELNPAVVTELEGLLDMARAGEIVGIAYATQHPADLTSFHYVGRITRSAIGALVLLQHRMCKADLEDR